MGTKEGSSSLSALIKKLNGTAEAALEVQLPLGGEHHYYSNFPSYMDAIKEGTASVQHMLSTCEAVVRSRRAAAPDFTDADDVAEWTSSLLDDVLERVDSALDAERIGARRGAGAKGEAAAGSSGPDNVALMANLPSFGGDPVRATRHKGPVRHAAGLARPQDAFDPPPDNRPDVPWRPRVAHLAGLTSAPLDPRTYEAGPGAPEDYPHPFLAELSSLEYPASQLRPPEPSAAPPSLPEETQLVWVDTPAALAAMVSDLDSQGVTELAVDLEQHGYRSFQGFTCLMQLSTRSTDYVVDTLALRNQLGPALARIFADPRVVKVLHGADSDVEWLQRDHSLFLVNMFDTGQAARVLSLQSKGLAHLLETLCGFQADKRYQLADWRLRPLSPDMLHYARCDTHYLLYVYDKLREQLRALPDDKIPPSLSVPLPPGNPGGALGLVLERSRQLCLKTYHKPAFSSTGYEDTLVRWGLTLSPQQTSVFSALLVWRDRVSRAEDESPGYVLPKAQLVALAQAMPDNAKRVQAVLGRAVSEVLLRRIAEVVAAIADARHRHIQPAKASVPVAGSSAVAAASTLPSAAAGGDSAPGALALGAACAAGSDPAGEASAVPAAAGPQKALPALKPRAVAPIKKASAAVAVAAKPAAPAAAVANAGAGAVAGDEGAATLTKAEPQGGAEEQRTQDGVGGSGAPQAISGPAPADAPEGAARPGLKPRALKAPTKAVSRSAALFGGGGGDGGGAGGGASKRAEAPVAADAQPANTDAASGVAAADADGAAASGVKPGEPAAAVAPTAEPGQASKPETTAELSAPSTSVGGGASSGGLGKPGLAGARVAPGIKRPVGSSILGAIFGGPGASVSTSNAAGTARAAQQQPGTSAAAASGPSSSARAGGAGDVAGGGDDDEEARAAQQRAKRLRSTFALPFVAAAPSPLPAVKRAKRDNGGGGGGSAGEEAAAAVPAAPAPRGGPSATAADVRTAVEALRAEGDVEVIMGADGRGVAVPAGSAAAEAAAAAALGSGHRRGGGAGGSGASNLADAPPEVRRGALDSDDEAGEVPEAEAAGGGAELDGAAAGQVAGRQLGLDVLEYVPLPLSQLYRKDRDMDRKKRSDQEAGRKRGGAPSAPGGEAEAAVEAAQYVAPKRRFTTAVEDAAGATGASDDDSEPASGGGGDESDGSESDGGHTVGPFAKKRRQAPKKKPTDVVAKAQGEQVGGGQAARGRQGRKAGGRGGKPQLTGLLADFPKTNLIPVAAAPDGGRGGRGGRNGNGRGQRGGGRGGRQPTAFNPYDIPDEFLMKGGKRSAVMPRSGNRSFTFK